MSEAAAIENVVRWLRNGCDPVAAATELDIIAKRIRRTADQPAVARPIVGLTCPVCGSNRQCDCGPGSPL